MRRNLFAILSAAVLSGCFSAGEGVDVPTERIYFPVGVAVTRDASHLLVASSDFDLQFNGGAIQSYDLERLRAVIPHPCSPGADDCGDGRYCHPEAEVCVDRSGEFADAPCGALRERSVSDRILNPGRCEFIDPDSPPGGGDSLITDSVKIGAFATDALLREWPGGGGERLYVPVRGDATLHWMDVDAEGRIDCGQDNNDGACDGRHRAGDDPDTENTRDAELQAEPFAIAATRTTDTAGAPNEAIVVTNQTSGTAALFVDDWSSDGPRLEFNLNDNFPQRPVGLAALPALSDRQPGFLMVYRNAPLVQVLRYFNDDGAAPPRPFLANAGAAPVVINSLGTDSRGIAVDASRMEAVRDACDDEACRRAAELTPADVYVANRSPASLLIGETSPVPADFPTFQRSLPLTFGPSRVVLGNVLDASGRVARRVFVVCFDSRRIFVYDPKLGRFESELVTGRGPHALAFDVRSEADAATGESPRALLYVGHFTDSFIGVISLDQRYPKTYGTMIATLGKPTPPRASK